MVGICSESDYVVAPHRSEEGRLVQPVAMSAKGSQVV